MSLTQSDNFDRSVTPSETNEPIKNILSEVYASRNSLNDLRELNESSRNRDSLPVLPSLKLFDPAAPESKPVSKEDRAKVVADAMCDLANPKREGSAEPLKDKPPLTKEEKIARAWELMFEQVENAEKKEEQLNEDVEKASKAIKAGDFEELSKIIKRLSKAGDDDQFGKWQKRLSKEFGINLDSSGDGSFEIHFGDKTDPNAKDKEHTVKTVKFDKEGKVKSAEQTTSGGFTGATKTEELDIEKTFKELQKELEAKSKSKK